MLPVIALYCVLQVPIDAGDRTKYKTKVCSDSASIVEVYYASYKIKHGGLVMTDPDGKVLFARSK